MNCFVIMPFDPSFDDVYSMIKQLLKALLQIKKSNAFVLMKRNRQVELLIGY